MKALILYVVFVVIGALISTGVGYYVEKEISSTASLVVFLATFRRKIGVFGIVAGEARKTRPAGGGGRVLKSLIDGGRQAPTVQPAFPWHDRC
jgi:hypothetical protein